MIDMKIGASLLTLEQDDRLTISKNCVVNLFPLLHADVRYELRSYFMRIEDVVAENLNERHDHCVLRCLFCLDHVLSVHDSSRQNAKVINKVH